VERREGMASSKALVQQRSSALSITQMRLLADTPPAGTFTKTIVVITRPRRCKRVPI
jgi:hypothetical protein